MLYIDGREHRWWEQPCLSHYFGDLSGDNTAQGLSSLLTLWPVFFAFLGAVSLFFFFLSRPFASVEIGVKG